MPATRVRTPAWLAPLVGAAALLLGGCLSKSELPPPRYYRPGPALPPESGQTAAQPSPEAAATTRLLRLREVTAAAHLRERMVWAQPDGEYGFYEDARWTETPADYVQAALARALFEQGRFRRASGGDVPILDIHVTAFEEVVGADAAPDAAHRARVAVRLVLSSREGQALLERTLDATRPVASGNGAAAVALATGEALDEVVKDAVQAIATAYPPP